MKMLHKNLIQINAKEIVRWGAGLRKNGTFEPVLLPDLAGDFLAAKYFCSCCGKPALLGVPNSSPTYAIHEFTGEVSPKFACEHCPYTQTLTLFRWVDWVRNLLGIPHENETNRSLS